MPLGENMENPDDEPSGHQSRMHDLRPVSYRCILFRHSCSSRVSTSCRTALPLADPYLWGLLWERRSWIFVELGACPSEGCYVASRMSAVDSRNALQDALDLLSAYHNYSEIDSCLSISFPMCPDLSRHRLHRLVVQKASVGFPYGPNDSPTPRCIWHLNQISGSNAIDHRMCVPFGRIALLLDLGKYALRLVIDTV